MAGEIGDFKNLYLVGTVKGYKFQVLVHVTGRDPLVGRISGVEDDSIFGDFPGTELLNVPGVAAEIRGEVRCAEFEEPLVMQAEVLSRRDFKGGCRLHLRWTRPEEFKYQLTNRLQRTFNRRKAYRVPPDPNEPVTALIGAQKGSSQEGYTIEPDVIEVAAGGLTIELQAGAETRLATLSKMNLALTIPGQESALILEVWLRHRFLFGRSVRYGLQYVLSESKEYEAAIEAIVDYVLKRQREILNVRGTGGKKPIEEAAAARPSRSRSRRRR